MRAVVLDGFGGTDVIRWGEVADLTPGPGEVLLDVAATAVNRADLMQREGHYPPPPGASDILGLECSGTVVARGPGVTEPQLGDQVCALLTGGGYAEQVVVPVGQLMPLPTGIDLVDAAALPEVACTVHANIGMAAGLSADEVFLVHGGSSGIGTFAIQYARALGARVAVTAGTAAKLERCRELGADILINYREQDFVAEVRAATDGHGADVILDNMGAKYLARNVDLLASEGRLSIIGLQGGRSAELDIGALLYKRGRILAASLRARPAAAKAVICASVRDVVWPLVDKGEIAPVIDRVMSLEQAADAHQLLADSGHIGKVVLTVPR